MNVAHRDWRTPRFSRSRDFCEVLEEVLAAPEDDRRHDDVELVDDAGLRRRVRLQGTGLSQPTAPNDLWCADYKGEFMLANRQYCYPLTITDFATRYLLGCEALSTTQERYAFTVFERVFQEFGMPRAIRTDNGVPFASAHALYGLSKLSVWWLRLGIQLERIKPGCPQQNGRHERMHLTLKREATKPASRNELQQQARFDAFIAEYNDQRPHEALGMQVRQTSTRRRLGRTAGSRRSSTRCTTGRRPSPRAAGFAIGRGKST